MKTQRLGTTDLEVSTLSYGCMRIPGTWNPSDVDAPKRERAHAAVLAAWEAGYNFFDHADIYCSGMAETLFGEVMKTTPSLKTGAIIATKCGIRFNGDPNPDSPHRYDFSKEWILSSCDKSLARLGVETIDLYQLHRPDLLMDPYDIAEAFSILRTKGKVRYFGVSNFLPSMVSALQSALPEPLQVNQVEIHLGRLAPYTDGTLDQCLQNGLTPLAWSPLGGGWLGDGGTAPEGREALLALMDEIATARGESRTVIALSWLMKHPSKTIPIVGSVDPGRIRDAARAADLELTRDEWYRLLLAARGSALP